MLLVLSHGSPCPPVPPHFQLLPSTLSSSPPNSSSIFSRGMTGTIPHKHLCPLFPEWRVTYEGIVGYTNPLPNELLNHLISERVNTWIASGPHYKQFRGCLYSSENHPASVCSRLLQIEINFSLML